MSKVLSTKPGRAPALQSEAVLAQLAAWSEHGWLRPLDHAFARFAGELAPDGDAGVLLAAALLAHVEGRGHTCLPLDALCLPNVAATAAMLDWPDEAIVELRALLARLPMAGESTSVGWQAVLHASALVEAIDSAARLRRPVRAEPLVLRGDKLYLRRYWRHECEVALQVAARGNAALHQVDAQQARHWLDRLFPPAAAAAPQPDIDWQKVACALALRGALTVITGGPGTGKTYTAARLLALLFATEPQPQRLRIALAAPTGKAAARLKQSIDAALGELQARLGSALPLSDLAAAIGPARTLHALLGARPDTRRFRHDAAHPLEVDVLFVDEASMVHLEMMAALLAAVPLGARVVLLGDKDQLASVEAGAVLGELCRDADQGRFEAETVDYVAAASGQIIPHAMRWLPTAGSAASALASAPATAVASAPAAARALASASGSAPVSAPDLKFAPAPALAQHTVMLRESRRFGGPIGQLAQAVNAGDAAAAEALLQRQQQQHQQHQQQQQLGDAGAARALLRIEAPTPQAIVTLARRGRDGAPGGYGSYLDALAARPAGASAEQHDAWVRAVLLAFERFRVLCAAREGEWGAQQINRAIERALLQDGALTRRGEWYAGRPVMVTRNDRALGVFNGDIGIALQPLDASAPLRAYFLEGDSARSVGVSRLVDVETAFAMTVHKSQGSEFEHVALVLPAAPSRVLTRELVYTGITRARSAFTLVAGRAQAWTEALAQRTQRSSGLRELLP